MSTASPAVRAKSAVLSDEHSVRAPAYQTLADDLRAQIVAGRLRPGERLPTEPQLCARFGLSRSTVREALRLLASQHLIVTTRGVTGGSFVAQPSAGAAGRVRSPPPCRCCGPAPRSPARSSSRCGRCWRCRRPGWRPSGVPRRTWPSCARRCSTRTSPTWTRCWPRTGRSTPRWPRAGNPLFELLAGPLRRLANDRELAAMGPAEIWHESRRRVRPTSLRCVEARDGTGAAAALRAHLRFLCDIYQQDEIRLAAQ